MTNVDPDHLINWGSAENYADGFFRFATGKAVRLLVVSADDPALLAYGAGPSGGGERQHRDRHHHVRREPGRRRSVLRCRLRRTGSSFELRTAEEGGPVTLSVPGDYNVRNAAASYAVGARLGVPDEVIRVQLARVSRHLSALPIGGHGRRHSGLRRLCAPSD